MLRVIVLLLLPLAILAYDEEEKKCNALLRDVNIEWKKGPLSEELQTRDGLEDLHDANEIKISGDHVPILCAHTFANFPYLMMLSLKSNKILEIRPGAFSKLDLLIQLDLNNNHLEEIKEGVFNFLNVSILHLEGNFIETINPNAFDDMPKLKLLYLSNNRIRSIDSEWFKNTPDVSHLFLNQNEITSIQARAFENLKARHVVDDYEILLNLDLSENKIKYVHSQAFDGLDEIGLVDLSGNLIEDLSENLFATATHVGTLWLTNNQIRCFPDRLENLLKAERTLLGNNPWDCTCAKAIQAWGYKVNRNFDIAAALVKCYISTP